MFVCGLIRSVDAARLTGFDASSNQSTQVEVETKHSEAGKEGNKHTC